MISSKAYCRGELVYIFSSCSDYIACYNYYFVSFSLLNFEQIYKLQYNIHTSLLKKVCVYLQIFSCRIARLTVFLSADKSIKCSSDSTFLSISNTLVSSSEFLPSEIHSCQFSTLYWHGEDSRLFRLPSVALTSTFVWIFDKYPSNLTHYLFVNMATITHLQCTCGSHDTIRMCNKWQTKK